MDEKRLRTALLRWYRVHGRSELPWRHTRDPYRTLVSEFMLQQTQVDRVVPKFEAFLTAFPGIEALARASVADVLRAWKGLGYNSRALRLKRVAGEIVAAHGGRVPREREALLAMPGIGAYTAAAIRSFGYDLDDAPIDTNLRRVVHRLAFGVEYPPAATPAEIDRTARALQPPGKAHDWNSAVMDLGATICTARAPKCLLCPLRAACAAAPIDAAALERARARAAAPRSKSERFEESARYARGRIVDRLRELAPGQRISLLDLHGALEPVLPGRTLAEVEGLVDMLERDGLIAREAAGLALAE